MSTPAGGRWSIGTRCSRLSAGGRIAGAGLDVFHDEPLKPGDPLLGLENTVLSPHNAGQTPEVRRDGLLAAIENVERFLSGSPINVVRA